MKHFCFLAATLLSSFFAFCISVIHSLSPDGFSLLALKSAVTKDPNQALVSWSDSDSTPCHWVGIECDESSQRVTSISLSSKNLTSYIPSEIGALSALTFLDLSHNSFYGPLPLSIASLRALAHLDLSCNIFNGTLPESLSNLSSLRGVLNLSYNAFSGEIPASFGLFPVMVSLDLRQNNLTGRIPQVGSLLNQGPTAFAGNPYLCGFPLGFQCTTSEAQSPTFSENPVKPGNSGVSSKGLVESKKVRIGAVTISVISGVLIFIGVVFVSIWVIRRKWQKVENKSGKENVGGIGSNEDGKKGKFVVLDEGFGFELEDLLRASAYVVGKSRSGIVYKVVAGGGGPEAAAVAVRRLSEGDVKWRLKEFEAEVEAIGKVQHPYIVRLRAYYYASDEKLLVSDFIRNGSLHNALHGIAGAPGTSLPSLTWAARLRIMQEIAQALSHIHECSSRKYVHGSIKSSKILLNENLRPYISGFGLFQLVLSASKMSNAYKQEHALRSKSSVSSYVVAPEARDPSTRITQKCDVYSFGILLLEILTGRAPDGGPDSNGKGLDCVVRKVFREERPLSEVIDPNLLHEVHAKKQVVGTFHIALNCVELDPEARPKMRTVSDNLDHIKLQ